MSNESRAIMRNRFSRFVAMDKTLLGGTPAAAAPGWDCGERLARRAMRVDSIDHRAECSEHARS